MINWKAIVEEVPALRRYARSLLRDRDRADDLVQATLEKAAGKWAFFNTGKKLRPWLFKILYNLFIDDYRSCKKNQSYENLPPNETCFIQSEAPFSQKTAESSVVYIGMDLQSALSELSCESRALFLMVSLEGFTYRQISKIFNIPQGTVMSRLSRIRAQLRLYLIDYQDEQQGDSQRRPELKSDSEDLL